MMTEAFQEERWETPVSNAKSLAMVSLVDWNGLHITVQDLRDPERRRYQFTFRCVPAYRNILEEYRTSEASESLVEGDLGWTVKVSKSPWLETLSQAEPLLEVLTPGCAHYVIITEDDVIDVLSPEPPVISELLPAAEDDPLPGKSHVLRHPVDREQIDQVLNQIRERQELEMSRRDWYCEDVLSGNLEVRRVWEDDRVLAFHHPQPVAEIHVVVVPKTHVASILDEDALDGALLSSMMKAIQETATSLGLLKR